MSGPTIAIIGAGFAGYNAARVLARRMPDSEVVLVNPTDYFLYLPLLPEVAAGILDPRRVTVSIPGTLRKVRLLLGSVESVHLEEKRLTYVDPEGDRGELVLRPRPADHRKRQQAAAHPGRREVRPRLPQHRRGALPA